MPVVKSPSILRPLSPCSVRIGNFATRLAVGWTETRHGVALCARCCKAPKLPTTVTGVDVHQALEAIEPALVSPLRSLVVARSQVRVDTAVCVYKESAGPALVGPRGPRREGCTASPCAS